MAEAATRAAADGLAAGSTATRRRVAWVPQLVIWGGMLLTLLPIYIVFVASTQAVDEIFRVPMSLLPGRHFIDVYSQVLLRGGSGQNKAGTVGSMMLNSLIVALVIAGGKIAISLLSAYAVVFFRFPLRMVFFWMIFVTLMLPIEVRILPTYQVVAGLGLTNTYAGLTIPLIASATATLLFRQFFLTIPDEMLEAAKIDGAGPLRFFWDVVVPLSRTNMAALFVILFIYGWNQYLWPLLITTDTGMDTIVVGIRKLLGGSDAVTAWNEVMATAILALLPPVAIVVLMQRWFIKGLVDSEK
jgi:sn-glycerol 3-phosphate transport system permease protein